LRISAGVFGRLVLVVFLLTIASCRKHQEQSADATAKKGPLQKWAFSTGAQALTGAALGPDGAIYVGASDGLFAISAEGKFKWKYSVALGLHAPPAVAPDGTLYVASSWGGFETLNPDGTRQWESGHGMIGFDSSPAVGNRTAYLANKVSDLWAFEPGKTNSLDWQIQTERGGLGFNVPTLPGSASVNQARSSASPVIGPLDNLYVPRQHWLHSIGSDGTPGWQLFLTNAMLGPAAVGQNGILYLGDTGSSKPKLFSATPDGSLRWQLDLPAQIVGSPVVDAKGNVFISTTTQLMAVSSDGTVSWKTKLNDRCASSPALTEDGTLYVGLDSNQLIAVDADGKQKWSLRTRGIVRWPPVISTDGTIYAATDGGEVIALQDAGSPLMRNAWPRYQHDSQNTGRIADF
jgi:outer membrane protein assembly factor BamB